MQLSIIFLYLAALPHITFARETADEKDLSTRHLVDYANKPQPAPLSERAIDESVPSRLWKRKGGGGRGGGGGGGRWAFQFPGRWRSSGSKGGKDKKGAKQLTNTSNRRGGKSGGGGSGRLAFQSPRSSGFSGSKGPKGPKESKGGKDKKGPKQLTNTPILSGGGSVPKFTGAGGKKFFKGGVTKPYTPGLRSPSGITPFLVPLALTAGLFTGLWLYSVFSYPWVNPLVYRNQNDDLNIPSQYSFLGQNITLPVQCLCEEFSVCGCDEVHDNDYSKSILNDAFSTVNGTSAQIKEVNGTWTLVINGTLPNGTTEDALNSGMRSAAPGVWGALVVALAGLVVVVV